MTEARDHFIHRTVAGERWDTIAAKWYGDAALDHVIVKANRWLFIDPLEPIPPVLPGGLSIIVPVLPSEEVDPNQLPPWRRVQPIGDA